jgi:hypothetical protein
VGRGRYKRRGLEDEYGGNILYICYVNGKMRNGGREDKGE